MDLHVKNGKAGQTVEVTCGESLSGDLVGNSWGWVQQWTLRDGEQTLTQHKFMECRCPGPPGAFKRPWRFPQ
jgi:hypothetical protein